MRASPALSAPVRHDERWAWLWIAAIVALAAAVYAKSLNGPFLFDDIPGIVENDSIRRLSDLKRVLHPPTEGSAVDSRPIINLSLALNYAVSALEPRGYRLTNLAIHLAAALTLFGLVRRSVERPRFSDRMRANAIPLGGCIALGWAVHPLLTETVICVIQRTESVVTLWYLVTLYCFARATAPEGRRHWLIGAWAACLLGMASKEVMASAPLMVFLYDRTFVAGTFREAWRQRGRWHLAFAATWLLLAYLVIDSGGARGGTAGYGQGVSAWTYLLTQARALTLYLKLSLWPHPLIVDYGDWLASGLSEVLPEALFVVGLLALTVWAMIRRPAAGFLGAVFFAVLAPSSSVYPLVSQTIAEHRMYLPLAPVLTLIAVALFRLPTRLAVAIGLACAMAGGFLTIRRGADYSSEMALWTDVVTKLPTNPWAHFNLGKIHFRQGRLTEAEAANRAALAIRPAHAEANFALGLALERQGRVVEAADSYQRAAELRPDDVQAHFRLGSCLLQIGRVDEALRHFATVTRLQPEHADAAGNQGAILAQLGRLDEAIPQFERVLALRPNSIPAHYNLALVYERLGRTQVALSHFSAAARLSPADPEIQVGFARALIRVQRATEARTVLERTLSAAEYAPARQLLDFLKQSAR